MSEINLFEEFKESSQEEWIQKINLDLKGKPLESVFWESEMGAINPVLFDSEIKNTNPGQFPFTRSTKIGNNTWNIRQQFDCRNENTNANLLKALEGGVNAVELLHLNSDVNFSELFNNIQIDIVQIYIHIDGANGIAICNLFDTFCSTEKYNPELITGGIIFDPVDELNTTGNLKFNKAIPDALVSLRNTYPNLVIFGVNASTYAEAGAELSTQVACALSQGHEYLVQRLEMGEELLEIVNSIEFTFSIGTSYFMEIAKLRAFRTLWSTIITEYDNSLTRFEIKINAQTSNLYYTLNDKYNNLLRATTSGMSAVIAGVDSLVVLPFDNNEVVESESFGLRIAKNIQLLMQEEAYLNQVIDPSGGSYYIEELTNKLQDLAWQEFKELEAVGGIMQAVIQGELQKKIEKQFQKKQAQLDNKTKVMIGVNQFKNENEKLGTLKTNLTLENTLVEPFKAKRLAHKFEME